MTSVIIPPSVTSIGRYAFHGCTALASIHIPSSVVSIAADAFSLCPALVCIAVDPANPVYDSRNGCNAIVKKDTNELVVGCAGTIIPPSVSVIGKAAFIECPSLVSITIPSSVTSIGDYAFCGCSSLPSIEIPSSVDFVGEAAFKGCNALTIYCEAKTTPSGWHHDWNPSLCPVLRGQKR